MSEEGMLTIPNLQYYCMTPYDADFKGVHILFPKENVNNTLGEYLSAKGLTQLHTAETEKYAHVTFFFNGGREEPFKGEGRTLVPSPKVATYGIYNAIEKAVVAVDACVKDVVETAKQMGYDTIIIADHGNADHALNEDGTPNTQHSLNPVPFIYISDNKNATVENGILADVAPSILHIMGLEQPKEMTGHCLIKD